MRRTLALLAALTMVMGLLLGSAAPAKAAPGGWLARINAFRAQHGLGPLIEDVAVTTIAQTWTQHMASTNTLAHNPLLAQEILPLVRYGENVGVYVDEATVFQQFTSSPTHRANLLGPYNVVGIGQVVSRGRVWTTHDFAFNPVLPVLPPPAPDHLHGDRRRAVNGWDVDGHQHRSGRSQGRRTPLRAADRGAQLLVVGMAGTPSGGGYWLVASDGGDGFGPEEGIFALAGLALVGG